MLSRLFSTALAAVLIAVVAVVSSPPATAGVERERVIVQVRDADPADVARDVAGRHAGDVSHVYRHAISGFAIELPAPAVAALRSDPRVVRVEQDRPVRMFEVPTGVARTAITENALADIDGDDDARVDVDIAVLDTGIDATHPDLDVAGGVDCMTGRCVELATPIDDNGHGTHVAGTAAAIDDGQGVVGAAPGARLWSVKVLAANGSGSNSTVMAGLDWLVDNADEVEVANTSLGCDPELSGCSSATLDAAVSAVADAGVVLVAAAGNGGDDIDGHALTSHPDVITVSAMADLDGEPGAATSGSCHGEQDDTFASFSSHGDAVDLAAPGVCIVSTWPSALDPDGDGYVLLSGTSMAAPHVAGAAGLYIVEQGVPRSSTRPTTVREGVIADWSVAQTGGCGFTGGVTDERMLYLADCSLAASSNSAPTVAIGEPDDGTRVTVGDAVTFAGVAADDEDGDLTEEITWTSDLDGSLGSGGRISAELSEGSHAVTATVRDSGDKKATDTITVHVDPEPSIGRLAGSDRITTAIEISQEAFADGAGAAVLAFAGGFPDALAATPLATALEGPVLLNARDHLHADVATELRRLGVSDVYVMGGTAVQTAQVEQDLRDRGLRPVRISGADRFATAAEAAESAMQIWRTSGAQVSSDAVVALGTDFPDALSGGALAGTGRAPLLLTGGDHLPAATVDALRDLGVTGVALMGGTAAVSDSVASELEQRGYAVGRIAGATRFHTAVAAAEVAVRAGASYRSVLIASGRSFPDALTGAPAVVSRGGVLLLSERDDLPDPSSEALRTADDVNWVRLAGGTAVLTDAVRDEAAAASGISP